jgi:imidazolonepropionase
MKMLRVIGKTQQNYPVAIKATFLGAHAFLLEYKQNQQGYIDLIVNEMIPKIAAENLAEYIDVFRNRLFFIEQTDAILKAGRARTHP